MRVIVVPDNLAPPFKGFFSGKTPGAEPEAVAAAFGLRREEVYLPIQKHTDKVVIIDSSMEPTIGDAVITKRQGIVLGVQVADCVPILFFDRKTGVIGAVHAGWRGTAAGILRNAVKAAIERFSCEPENIFVAFGPSIRWCCYPVDPDVARSVERATGRGDYLLVKGAKYCLDLPAANRSQALGMGIPEANIWMSEDCTFCHPARYFSYRFAKGPTGRQGGFIVRT